jgi:hypothetical protein
MPTPGQLPVCDLSIDLTNFRTVTQGNDHDAIRAMIAISPSFFWGLMESLLDDGYLPTENILVLETSSGERVVKEGNRRVAALKIALGIVDVSDMDFPPAIAKRIATLPAEWIAANSLVPCTVYQPADSALVDKIVTLTHGKGLKAGRDPWKAVAKARHNRQMTGAVEAGLDILEKFLSSGTNHTQEQRDRWAGDYNLTVLDEAIKRLAPRLGASSSTDLAKQYPKIEYRKQLDEIIRAIGLEMLTFTMIRDSDRDFAAPFGIPPTPSAEPKNPSPDSPGEPGGTPEGAGDAKDQQEPGQPSDPDRSGGNSEAEPPADPEDDKEEAKPKPGTGKPAAAPMDDERSVRRALKSLALTGENRSKIATLRVEILRLKLDKNPLAFCFLLRSIFEISAKAYCEDNAPNGPSVSKPDGSDRSLISVLKDIITYLTQNEKDKGMVKLLKGAEVELARDQGILSVNSLNQLVHNPKFGVKPSDIAISFMNAFPLLDAMNTAQP